jgi:hypothetical protein
MSDAASLAGSWGCKEEMAVNSFVGYGFLFLRGGGAGVGGDGNGFEIGSAGLMLGPIAAAESTEVVLGTIMEPAEVLGVFGWVAGVRIERTAGLLGNWRRGVIRDYHTTLSLLGLVGASSSRGLAGAWLGRGEPVTGCLKAGVSVMTGGCGFW